MNTHLRRSIPAADWHAMLRTSAVEAAAPARPELPFAVAHFVATPPDVVQPSLLDDVVCLHLGGAKRVRRVREGRTDDFDVPVNSLTVMPRLRPARWRTTGPIDYVHVTLRPRPFERLLAEETGKAREEVELRDVVAAESPLLLGLAAEMARIGRGGEATRLHVDALFTAFAIALLRHGSDVRGLPPFEAPSGPASGGMAGWRLRRVVDFMAANLAGDIDLDDLAQVSGLSRAQFFRSFRQETGTSPARYLERMRVREARGAIERGCSLPEASAAAGFGSTDAMTRAFLRVLHVTPGVYRRWQR